MPASGTPVASTITSISGQRDQRLGVGGHVGAPRLQRVAERGRRERLRRPSRRCASWLRARATSRSATPTTCMPRVRRACARNMVPNLPAPIRPTRHRPAGGLARKQHGVEIHGDLAVPIDARARCGHAEVIACGKLRYWQIARVTKIWSGIACGSGALCDSTWSGISARNGCRRSCRPEALAAAERIGGRLAIGRAVRRDCAAFAPGITRALGRPMTVRRSPSLTAVAGLSPNLSSVSCASVHVRLELGRALLQPAADRIDEAGLEGIGRRRRGSARLAGAGSPRTWVGIARRRRILRRRRKRRRARRCQARQAPSPACAQERVASRAADRRCFADFCWLMSAAHPDFVPPRNQGATCARPWRK